MIFGFAASSSIFFLRFSMCTMESDGKIYSTCTTFGINTVIGPSSLVGDKPGWTVDQLLAAYKKMPDGATIFDEGTTRADVLATCLSMATIYMIPSLLLFLHGEEYLVEGIANSGSVKG